MNRNNSMMNPPLAHIPLINFYIYDEWQAYGAITIKLILSFVNSLTILIRYSIKWRISRLD